LKNDDFVDYKDFISIGASLACPVEFPFRWICLDVSANCCYYAFL